MITTQERTKEVYKRQKLDNVLDKRITGTANKKAKKVLDNRSMNLKVSNAEGLNSGTNTVANLALGSTGDSQVYGAVCNLLNKYDTNANALNDLRSYRSEKTDKYSKQILVQPIHGGVSSATPEPTYVASDPSQPDNIVNNTSNTDSGTITKHTEVLKLYDGVQRVNPNEYNYIDKTRNQPINSIHVLPPKDDSLIVRDDKPGYGVMSPYRLIPPEYLEQSDEIMTTDYNVISPDLYKDQISNILDIPQIKGDISTIPRIRYRYQYSFDGIVAAHKSIKNTGGYLSAEIDVGNFTYIQLDAPVYQNIEYTILDGKDEVPILPIQQDTVKGEKLFYGLLPRFTVMNDGEFTVYKDGAAITINNLTDLNLFLSVNNTGVESSQSSFVNSSVYTIDYIPDIAAQTYYPQNKTIRLKIIQRNFNGDVQPISKVTIKKYRNTSSWYLSSFDEIGDYDERDIRVTRYVNPVR